MSKRSAAPMPASCVALIPRTMQKLSNSWIAAPVLPLIAAMLVPASSTGTAIVAITILLGLPILLGGAPPMVSQLGISDSFVTRIKRYWLLIAFAVFSGISFLPARREQWWMILAMSVISWERGLPSLQVAIVTLFQGRWLAPIVCVLISVSIAAAFLLSVGAAPSELSFRVAVAVLFGFGTLMASGLIHGTHQGRPWPQLIFAGLLVLWLVISSSATPNEAPRDNWPAPPVPTGNSVGDDLDVEAVRGRAVDSSGNQVPVPTTTNEAAKPTIVVAARPSPPWSPAACPIEDETAAAPVKAIPCGSFDQWVRSVDYPADAVRQNAQGTVKMKAIIGTDGRVRDCKVEGSSGHRNLDEDTCRLIEERARFIPARDAARQPIETEYTVTFTWRLE